MRTKINKIIIAKDGFPLETFRGYPITNWIRKLLHASHTECRDCYNNKIAMKNHTPNGVMFTNERK